MVGRCERLLDSGPVEARGFFRAVLGWAFSGTFARGFISGGGLTEMTVESLLRLAGSLATSLELETAFGLLIEVPPGFPGTADDFETERKLCIRPFEVVIALQVIEQSPQGSFTYFSS
jgi:hypothetical protein